RRRIPYSPQAAADRGSNSTCRAAPATSIITSRSVNADGPGRGIAGTGALRVAHVTHATATPATAATTNHTLQSLNRLRIATLPRRGPSYNKKGTGAFIVCRPFFHASRCQTAETVAAPRSNGLTVGHRQTGLTVQTGTPRPQTGLFGRNREPKIERGCDAV